MKSLALRFGENFAPQCGTIIAHSKIIEEFGYVWYGKFGNHLSKAKTDALLKENNPKILFIHSGTLNRYWAYISDISDAYDDINKVPEYYRDQVKKVKTWIKIWKFEPADKDVMKYCKVSSTNEPLSIVSKESMSPFFFIDYIGD